VLQQEFRNGILWIAIGMLALLFARVRHA
jgi:hypothetical protein